MKYPFVLFFRDDIHSYIDTFLKQNANQLQCTLNIINKKQQINKLFKSTYPLLVLFGNNEDYIDILNELTNSSLLNRVIQIQELTDIHSFNESINTKFIELCSIDRKQLRPIFSIFTTAFNSFDKILRAYNSLINQTLTNWEWVIVDDSPDEKNFYFLKNKLTHDNRIRLYRRFENSGYIGNVKNESICLCRGQYVLELDHDDEILPFVLEESTQLFKEQPDVGFIYMDFINIYENGNNFWYGNHLCKGYGAYYCQKYNGKWVYVYITPNINNITLSHLVCCPNHPRIWRRDILINIGNYSEHLPICDDYEILLRTALNTKIAKIHKFGYIQYMNNENNNFSLIRNAEINRIGPNYISPIFYDIFDIHNVMRNIDAYEDEKYLNDHTIIWKRDPQTYKHNFCNLLVNTTYDKQYCIIGLDSLIKNIDYITELYTNERYDFIVIENKCSIEYLWKRIDSYGFDRMKCYTLIDEPNSNLIKYFELCYLSTNNYEIINININKLPYNTLYDERHKIINKYTNSNSNYLEIGIEYGYTFNKTHFLNKTGVDPDPKFEASNGQIIFKLTSDDYFDTLNKNVTINNTDIIFIDGMHHYENVVKDFNNSLKILSQNGTIFIDDCIPLNYNEQLKIPRKHYYDNGILKYGEEWTGDVWKVMYHLLLHYNDKFKYQYFHNTNYRGVIMIKILEPFEISNELTINYDYFNDFNNYLGLLQNNNYNF
jgi:glycosyltransferase involved in cell wall biosynthesis